jgi:hypothetical protein
VIGGVFGLLFMGSSASGTLHSYSRPGWMGGHWWAVTGAAGVVVRLLRRVTQLPEKTPGIIAELQD